jgi:drug/metabolite transporter (DMT)-like permease
MVYLILTIVFSTAIVVSFRLFTNFRIDNLPAITTNYLIAAIMSFVIYQGDFSFSDIPLKPWFPFASIIGFTFILVFIVFALSSQKAGVAVTAVSSKMSVVIPVSFGILVYAEVINPIKISGIIASLLAFYLTFKKKDNQRIDKRVLILPILLFLGNGANDTLTKHAQKFHVGDETLMFLGTVFLSSMIIGGVLLLYKVIKEKKSIHYRSFIAGVWLGFLNFFSSYFFLLGMGLYDSSVFFPIFNVSIVSLAALSGFFFFRERLSPINWTGIVLALMAILLIAFGS